MTFEIDPKHIVERDLGTPEGLAWWDGLSEAEREKWRRRVAAGDGRNASGELIIGGLGNSAGEVEP